MLVCLEGLSLRDACDILGETVPEILEAETLIKSIATDLIKKNELLPADILRYRT